MAITINSTSASVLEENETTWSWEHTTHANDTGLIVVTMASDSSSSDANVTNVTFSGATPEELYYWLHAPSGYYNIEFWYLKDPDQSTTANINVTQAGKCTDLIGFALGISGEDQSDVLDQSGYESGNSASAQPNINLTCAADSFLVAGIIIEEAASGHLTAQSGTTEVTQVDMGAMHGLGGYAASLNGDTIAAWTHDTADENWYSAGITLNVGALAAFPPVPGRVHRDNRSVLLRM